MTESLADKVVIITGASSGIGAAMRAPAGSAGLQAHPGRPPSRRSYARPGGSAGLPRAWSFKRRHDRARLISANMVERTLERFGRVDVMLANAGVYIPGQFADGDIEALTRMFTLNVDGVLRCAHAVIPTMKAQGGGDIIVTSSISGTHGTSSASRSTAPVRTPCRPSCIPSAVSWPAPASA